MFEIYMKQLIYFTAFCRNVLVSFQLNYEPTIFGLFNEGNITVCGFDICVKFEVKTVHDCEIETKATSLI